jgi:pimeloyl-ACP methyl ester carboxylesterase
LQVGDRIRRFAGHSALVLGVLLLILLVAASLRFAGVLTAQPDGYPYGPNNRVLAVEGELVTLSAGTGWSLPGSRWGLRSANGYVRMLQLVERTDETVTWRTSGPSRQRPIIGADVRVDEYLAIGDPREARGLEFREVVVDGPLGAQPSWLVTAVGERVGTVVYVHGSGGTREEANRFLPVLVEAGWDVLVPTYRGDEDEGGPAAPGNRRTFGTTEWEDVEAAVDVVDDRPGALVLYGSSVGGSVVAQFLDRSPLAPAVDGVVLDSPLLSLDDAIELNAARDGIPGFAEPVLVPTIQLAADLRYGVGTGSLEQVADDGTFDVPTLVIHGDADAEAPIANSRELATLVDTVRLEEFPGAGHLVAWNVDRSRYGRLLREHLGAVARSSGR